MIIQVNINHNIESDVDLRKHAEAAVLNDLEYFASQVTRVEVHLTDVNGSIKGGANDKQCQMEARPAGLKPVSATHAAATPEEAIDGAAGKLKRQLEHILGQHGRH